MGLRLKIVTCKIHTTVPGIRHQAFITPLLDDYLSHSVSTIVIRGAENFYLFKISMII